MKRAVLAIVLGFLFLHQAHATPLRWTLSGVVFPSGATVSGGWTFDADAGLQPGLGVYSNIEVTTGPDSSFGGATYTLYNPVDTAPGGQFPSNLFLVTGAISSTMLVMVTAADMTDAGGTIPIFSDEFFCADPSCQTVSSFIRATDIGSVTAAPTPEPS